MASKSDDSDDGPCSRTVVGNYKNLNDFLMNGTQADKEIVFQRVLRKATAHQQQILNQAKRKL